VKPGESLSIVGPSGSGKTTTLNIIGALDTPSSGKVTVGGRDLTSSTRSELFALRRETVSFIFQSFNLFPGLTATENVEFGMDVSGRRVLDGGPPPDSEAFAKAVRHRDTWLARNWDGAVLVRRAYDRTLASVHWQLESALDGDVWVIEPD
jgi:predicted ABC-type transport system involved in lysophospholipase L1 biosynthesis ATPase subunit